MTALNIIAQPKARAGYILVDTAYTAPDGKVAALKSKVVQGGSTRFPWALGVTGNVEPVLVGEELSRVGVNSLKQLQRRLPDALRRAMAQTAEQFAATRTVQCAVRGIAWDFARKRPVGFMMVTDRDVSPVEGGRSMDPFDLYYTPCHLSMPSADGLEAALGRPINADEMENPAKFDVERDGLALMIAQRCTPMVPTVADCDHSVLHRIGGEAHLVTVTKHGVTCEAIWEWPDKVGHLIDPTQEGGVPADAIVPSKAAT